MKINASSIKYIQWRDPQGLHEDTTGCISELRFAKDELQFLDDLMKSHTLDLLSTINFDESRALASEISMKEKLLGPLMKKLIAHANLLQTLVDDIEVAGETEDYKNAHYKLMFEAAEYLAKFRKLKRKVFSLIKSILMDKKKRKLLNP
jgi:hypothetical protein